MLDEVQVNDEQLEVSDIRRLESADEIAHFFAKLRYDVDERLLLSLGKQSESRGMRAQTGLLRGPVSRLPRPVAHSSAPSRYSCGSHKTARLPLGSENTPRSSGAASPCGCRALPGCCQTAR